MGKKASAGGKKKGPKGKKARAKAKLERQWGEELTEEQVKEARKHRRGTTVKQASAASKNDLKNDSVTSYRSTPLDKPTEENEESDEDVGEQEKSGNALNSLLQAIQKNSSLRNKDDDDDISESHARNYQVSGNDKADDDESSDDDMDHDERNFDLFGLHFNRQTPPETSEEHSSENMIKLPVASLDDSIEIHLSSHLLNELKTSSGLPVRSDGSDLNWRRLANKSFAGVRKVLSTAWQGSGAGERSSKALMSSLQRVLYPCLTRYSDILMTAESPEVSGAHALSQLFLDQEFNT
jgi:hypothetical protein